MQYQFGQCRLDTDRREFMVAEVAVTLRPKVFDLLSYLIAERHRVVSKQELLKELWPGVHVGDASLTGSIKAVRKAVGDDGRSQSVIRTWHKNGYRFVAEVQELDGTGVSAGRETMPGNPADDLAKDVASRAENPVQPAIAVLPFDNMSGNPDDACFSDGITEDLITLLSRVRWLFVIARTSTFAYKGHPVDIKRISRELDVRYVVEGSVRRDGKRVRVTAQLIDATTRHHVWAEKYDRELENFFDLQDEIALTIATAVEPEVGLAEQERARRKPPESLSAWERYQNGLWHLFRYAKDDVARARVLFEDAIGMAPSFAPAYAYLGYSHFLDVMFDYERLRDWSLDQAEEAARQAIAIDQREPMGHTILGRALAARRDYEAGIPALRTALRLNPNLAYAHYGLAAVHVCMGRFEEAIPGLEQSRHLNPHGPYIWSIELYLACARIGMGDYAAAMAEARRGAQRSNATFWPQAALVSALGHMGRIEEAQRELAKLLSLKPDFSDFLEDRASFWLAEARPSFAKGLQEAGLQRAGKAG